MEARLIGLGLLLVLAGMFLERQRVRLEHERWLRKLSQVPLDEGYRAVVKRHQEFLDRVTKKNQEKPR